MAIQKKLLHFKKFSDFNSKKLSANENNTQYTLGVDGAVTDGSPDVLYQSICWIKDIQQQWTHGRLYDCSGGKDVYVLDFNISDLYSLMQHNTPVAVDANALEAAIRSNKVILIPEEPNDVGVCGRFLVTAYIEDMIYLQIAHLDTPSYYDVGIDLGATTVSYAEERYIQNKLVSGSNIKTINGSPILGSGDLQIYANEVLLQDGRDIELALDALDKKIDDSITTALNTEV